MDKRVFWLVQVGRIFGILIFIVFGYFYLTYKAHVGVLTFHLYDFDMCIALILSAGWIFAFTDILRRIKSWPW